MNKNSNLKLYWIFWGLTTVVTGILAGFLTSHSVMLGRFFSWLLENNHNEVFTEYFSVFRAETRANVHYNIFLYMGFIAGICFAIICFINKKTRIVALTAGISTFWVSVGFFTSDFNKFEEAVCSGIADVAAIESFLAWNLPLHISFACIYVVSFIILLITGFITRTKELMDK